MLTFQISQTVRGKFTKINVLAFDSRPDFDSDVKLVETDIGKYLEISGYKVQLYNMRYSSYHKYELIFTSSTKIYE